jgi:hypothetical protein
MITGICAMSGSSIMAFSIPAPLRTGITTAAMTTGTVSRAGTLKGWFVLVHDSTGRYADNKLWGDGWGWSWFDADKPAKTTSTNYQVDCLSCHVPAKATDS